MHTNLNTYQSLIVPHLHPLGSFYALELAQDVLVPLSPLVHRQHAWPVYVFDPLGFVVEILGDDHACPTQGEGLVLYGETVIAEEGFALDGIKSIGEKGQRCGGVFVSVPLQEVLEEQLSFMLVQCPTVLFSLLHCYLAFELLVKNDLDHLGNTLLVGVLSSDDQLIGQHFEPHCVLQASSHHIVQQFQRKPLHPFPNRVQVLLYMLQRPARIGQAEEQLPHGSIAEFLPKGSHGQFASQCQLIPHFIKQGAIIHGLNAHLDYSYVIDQLELEVSLVLPLLQKGNA